MPSEYFLYKTAPQFDVHKWSDYPEVTRVVNAIFEEIKKLRADRGQRVREADKVKRHLRVMLIDMWAAHKLSLNPYRGISKNKSDYQRTSRYRQIHLKYDYLVGVLNDLVQLEYVSEKKGYRFPAAAKRTRIKATDKLINKILNPEYGVNRVIEAQGLLSIIDSDGERQTILLHDAEDNPVEYEDTDSTILMRENLKRINAKLKSSRITLYVTDQQYAEIIEKINTEKDPQRRTIDFTSNQLHRVFNNSSWEEGGRFYGGWWLNLPKEYRKYIEINRKPTVELDYSGHHIRMLYASEGLDPPDDPYDLIDYDRQNQKDAVLIMLNASNTEKALKAMANKGIKGARKLSKALTDRHVAIQRHFFTGAGLNLMYQDSVIAEKITLLMLNRGAAVLPVHDSFIVRNSYETELEEIMKQVFEEHYGRQARLKIKKTVLQEIREQRQTNQEPFRFVTHNLNEIFEDSNNNYKWYGELWGF